MKGKPSFWQRIGLHDWFLKSHTGTAGTYTFRNAR
jgi:hypothetical protein